jgi:hypothetical protein
MASGLGHIGPAAFNTAVIAAAIAFLPVRDLDALSELLRRHGSWLLGLAPVWLTLSLRLYRGPIPWSIFALLQAVLLFVLVLLLAALLGERAPLRQRLRARRVRLRLPGGPRTRRLALLLIASVCLLGLSPYLGLQHRYAFAMLSNLRVDDARWNSVIVPRWVRPSEHDGYVHVLRVDPPIPRPKRGPPLLAPGLYSPQEFQQRFESSRRQGRRSAIELSYAGRHLASGDLATDLELDGFVHALPRRPLLRPTLALEGGQRCVH